MKWIKYQIVQCTVGEDDVLAIKKVGYSDANLAIAQGEAYNGQYEIIEDDTPAPPAGIVPTNLSDAVDSTSSVNDGVAATPAAVKKAYDLANGRAHATHEHKTSDIKDFPSSMTPSAHNQGANTITAGAFAGQVNANQDAVAAVGTAQVRDIYAGTSDMTAGTTPLATGTLYIVYE